MEEEDAVLETASATKPKVLKQASSDFMSCVKDVIPQNWQEERESLQQIAIYRWHSLLMSWHDSVDIVKALQHRTSQKEQFQIIVDIFYNKAPSTLMKRVRSLSRVVLIVAVAFHARRIRCMTSCVQKGSQELLRRE